MKRLILLVLLCVCYFTSPANPTKTTSSIYPDANNASKNWKIHLCAQLSVGGMASVNACMDFKCGSNMFHIFGCTALRVVSSTPAGITNMNDLVTYIEQQRGLQPGTLTELVITSNSIYQYEEHYYTIVGKAYPIINVDGERSIELELKETPILNLGQPGSTN